MTAGIELTSDDGATEPPTYKASATAIASSVLGDVRVTGQRVGELEERNAAPFWDRPELAGLILRG